MVHYTIVQQQSGIYSKVVLFAVSFFFNVALMKRRLKQTVDNTFLSKIFKTI